MGPMGSRGVPHRLRRREGIWLAAAVMALDVTANWLGNWARIRHDWESNVPWLITLFGVLVLATALPLLRVMKGSHRRIH